MMVVVKVGGTSYVFFNLFGCYCFKIRGKPFFFLLGLSPKFRLIEMRVTKLHAARFSPSSPKAGY